MLSWSDVIAFLIISIKLYSHGKLLGHFELLKQNFTTFNFGSDNSFAVSDHNALLLCGYNKYLPCAKEYCIVHLFSEIPLRFWL